MTELVRDTNPGAAIASVNICVLDRTCGDFETFNENGVFGPTTVDGSSPAYMIRKRGFAEEDRGDIVTEIQSSSRMIELELQLVGSALLAKKTQLEANDERSCLGALPHAGDADRCSSTRAQL